MEIPPTFIEDPEQEISLAEDSLVVRVSEADPLNDPSPFNEEAATQYLEIMLSKRSYSTLTEGERRFLCDYSGISDDRLVR